MPVALIAAPASSNATDTSIARRKASVEAARAAVRISGETSSVGRFNGATSDWNSRESTSVPGTCLAIDA
jgi:hypothetical protein